MNIQSQKVQKESKRINLLQEYHNEKRSEDQRIQLRKIFIWLFIILCAYMIFIKQDDNQQGHSISTQQSQQQAVETERIENQQSSHENSQSVESKIHQVQDTAQHIATSASNSNQHEEENGSSHQNGAQNVDGLEEPNLDDLTIEKLILQDDTPQLDQQEVPQQEI